MTETKGKEKAEIKTRQPQKKTQDTFANLRKPHPVEELLGLTQPTPPTAVTPLTPPTPPTSSTAAPTRDFAKVANSIVRQAVPSGAFSGKSKQLYDFLYTKTRGAIVPRRSVRLTKAAIMQGSHIGSERTMYKNLRRLEASGLVQARSIAGEQGGSEYTVLLPEEVAPLTPPTPPTDNTHTSHKVVTPLTAESGVSGVGLIVDSQTVCDDPKTSFKTKEEKFDDEAAPLGELFRELEKDLIGKNSASLQHWRDFRDLISTELRIAAARTTISNVPAFLTEHLRRRLWKLDKKAMEAVEGREVSPKPAKAKIDASSCPDCGNTGWWYPEGPDKGVAKCAHLKLQSDSPVKEVD